MSAGTNNFGLSPKKLLTPFKKCKSDDVSVAMGDDSNGWERKERQVMVRFAAQLEANEALDEAAFGNGGPMNEMMEWKYFADEMMMADNETAPLPPATEATMEVLMEFKKIRVPELQELAMRINVSQNGSKRILFNKILVELEGVMTKIDENTFKYSRAITKAAVGGTRKLATWINLNPQAIPQVDGVDMATDATVGFFGPTIKENVECGMWKGRNVITSFLGKKLSAQLLS